MSWSNYTYKQPEYSERKPGKYRVIILKAEEKTSKKGNKMVEISLRPSGTASTVKAYIVDNDYFDDNYSRFLDAFPDIKNADNNPEHCYTWRGAMGAINLKVNDNGYFEAGYFIPSEKQEALPEFVWKARDDEPQTMPEFQGAVELEELEDDESIPF